jgi:hypothetical protein
LPRFSGVVAQDEKRAFADIFAGGLRESWWQNVVNVW